MSAQATGSERAAGWVVGLFAASLGYATLRYNVAKHVAWADWPSYTLNKALGVASLLLFVVATIRGAGRRPAGTLLFAAGIFAVGHTLLSLSILDPGYYPKFFADGRLTAIAGASLAIGGLCTAVAEAGARRAPRWTEETRVAWLAALSVGIGLHAALPGVSGWFTPATWPAWMPPITLLSFLASGIAGVSWLRAWVRPRHIPHHFGTAGS